MLTEVNFIPVKFSGKNASLIGFASFLYNDAFFVGSIGVLKSDDGEIRLSFPAKNIKDTPIQVVHPINKDTYEMCKRAVEEKLESIGLL